MPGAEFATKKRTDHVSPRSAQPRQESRLLIQPKLVVGHADDPLEHEAERIAQRVLSDWSTHDGEQPSCDDGPVAVHAADAIVSRTPGPAGGREGGDVESATEHALQQALRGGRPITPALRRRYERAFDADFSAVRVHDDARSETLNREFGARAFTVGSDIFLGPGAPALDSDAGVRLMSHELTHTLQQGSQARRVQRDIGFEFETKHLETRQTADGSALPRDGFATPKDGKEAFEAGKRLAKSDALLTRGDLEVQADDWGSKSDLEVVVTHLPETNAGRLRLVSAIRDLQRLMRTYTGLAAMGGDYVPAEALDGTAGFGTPFVGSMFKGSWISATTMPQVTTGLRVGNIVDVVQDLQGAAFLPQTKKQAKAGGARVPDETPEEKAARDPGRRRFRGDKIDPTDNTTNDPSRKRRLNEAKDLSAGNEAHTLVLGLTHAKESVAKYTAKHKTAPGGKDLEGFLTLIFAYAEGGRHKGGFMKSHTPLMAKTDLATIWDQLPANVRTYYGEQVASGNTRLEELIATVSGYSGRMDQPLILVKGLADENTDDQGRILPDDKLDWYQSLIMRDWVRSICITQQRSKWQAIRETFAGTQSRQRKDKLKTSNFPNLPAGKEVEGYAALNDNMDTDATTATPLPVFELRSASRPVHFINLEQWATEVFDYLRALNASPNGAHPVIAGAPPA